MNKFFVNTVGENEDVPQCVMDMENILSKMTMVLKPKENLLESFTSTKETSDHGM